VAIRVTEASGALVDAGLSAAPPVSLPAAVNLVAGGPNYVIASTAQGPYRLVADSPPMPMGVVVDDAGAELNPGALLALAVRQIPPAQPVTSVLALSGLGLLQDFGDAFERWQTLGDLGSQATAVDDLTVAGASGGEQVWLAGPGQIASISALATRTYGLPATSTVTALLATNSRIELVIGGALEDLDPKTGMLRRVDHDFGSIGFLARGDSGESYLGSSLGLYVRSVDGSWATHYSLEGSAVAGLAADPLFGVYASTGSGLYALPFAGPLQVVGSFPDPGNHPLSVDGFGDVWAGSGSSVIQFQSGQPVGYVNQVKPFFAAHCYTCHVTSSLGSSPRLPLDDYEGAKGISTAIVLRLEGQGVSPMPPDPPLGPGSLAPSDYGVVVRWVNTGELP
jgi:hypothetical protein